MAKQKHLLSLALEFYWCFIFTHLKKQTVVLYTPLSLWAYYHTLCFSHCSSIAVMCVAVWLSVLHQCQALAQYQLSYWMGKLMNLFQCFHPLTKRWGWAGDLGTLSVLIQPFICSTHYPQPKGRVWPSQ